jgi:PAS domain S-box-containing protein
LNIRELDNLGKVEEKLREDLLRFQSAFDATYDGMWDLDLRTNQLYLSPKALKIFDYNQPAILNRDEIMNNIFHEEDKSRLENEILQIINGWTDLIDVESRVKTVPGVLKWIRLRGKAISSVKDGSIIRIVGTFADITSHKLIVEDLNRKQSHFKSYFENSSIGLAVNTLDDSWIELNRELCQMLGFNKEELLNKSWMEVVHPDDIQPILELIGSAIEGKIDCFNVDNRLIKKNGEILYVTLSCVCVRNDDGSIHHILTSVINKTERHKIEENLKNERIILRTLVDSLPFTIYIIDKEGRKLLSNKADFETIGAKNEGEVLGKTDLDLFPGEIGERGHKDNLFIIKNKVPIKNRLENFFDKDGHQKWLLTNKIPFFDQNDQVSGLIGFGIDITDIKNLQQKISDSEAYYRTLINISPDGIIVTDLKGVVSFISNRIYQIFGVPDNENLIGESVFNWLASESLEEAIVNFKDVIEGKRSPQTKEYKCLKFNRTEFWGELSSSPLFTSSGFPTGLMIVCRNISDRKKIEEDLIKAKNKAEESDKLKSALLRNISHEIRTPLNGILGFSSLLGEPGLSNEMLQSYVKTIQISSDHLLSIITDLIDISSVEAKIIEQQKSTINLNELLKDIQNLFRLRTTSKNLTLTLNEGLPNDKADIYTDKAKLVQIISNLLSNAIKFTKSGHINFGYLQKKSFLEFYVSDTGIGIPSKYHSKIFDTFFQVDNALSRSFEGTGLGLSICKAYVELLGGTIWLTSKLGEGSTFYFTIPHESGEISQLN